jgi:hypothetical protein
VVADEAGAFDMEVISTMCGYKARRYTRLPRVLDFRTSWLLWAWRRWRPVEGLSRREAAL